MKTFIGIVQKGREQGKRLGFPTINIPLTDPGLSGIYAGRVILEDEAPYMAAIYADPSRGMLEAHLLDFKDDLYGLPVSIEVCEKLRDSKKFSSIEMLKDAIAEDVANVRKYFKN